MTSGRISISLCDDEIELRHNDHFLYLERIVLRKYVPTWDRLAENEDWRIMRDKRIMESWCDVDDLGGITEYRRLYGLHLCKHYTSHFASFGHMRLWGCNSQLHNSKLNFMSLSS